MQKLNAMLPPLVALVEISGFRIQAYKAHLTSSERDTRAGGQCRKRGFFSGGMMCEHSRREIGGALLLTLLAALVGWPSSVMAAEDESLRSGEKIQSRSLPPPLALQNVATTLRTMGRADLADRLIRDYGTGKVRLGDPGSRATTDPPIIVPLVTNRRDNIMTLDKRQLTTQCDNKGTDRNPVTDGTLGWALTVVHEYVHMEQDNPTQTARFENAGWREAVHENQSWMRSVMSKVSEAERMPNSAEKVARLRELSRQLELLRVVHGDAINGLKEEIAEGHVGAGQEWPTIEAGSSADLNGVVASANTLVAANIKNTRDVIARIERELAAGTAVGPRSRSAPAPSATSAQPAQRRKVQGDWVMTSSSDGGNCNGTSMRFQQAPDGSVTAAEASVTCEKGVATGHWTGSNFRWTNADTLTWTYHFTARSVERLQDGSMTVTFQSSTVARETARDAAGNTHWGEYRKK